MTPPRRKKDLHLPPNIYFKHGAYYYRQKNKWMKIGKSLSEALKNYAELMEGKQYSYYMNGVFDRYLNEIAPKKSELTYNSRVNAIKFLKTAFGHLRPDEITPLLIYKYIDLRAKKSIFAANKEKSILHNVLSYAIRWGLITENVCRDVKSLPEPKRSRYIEDWEFNAVYQLAQPLIKCAMKLAYATGLRQNDILNLKLEDLKEDGLQVKTSKTGAHILFEYNNVLNTAIKECKQLKRPIGSFYLLSTKEGKAYTRDGFKSIWQRTMNKAIKINVIQNRFTFHDIRSKAATDAEKLHGREYARQLLGHTSQKITARYVKNANKIKPLTNEIVDNSTGSRQIK